MGAEREFGIDHKVCKECGENRAIGAFARTGQYTAGRDTICVRCRKKGEARGPRVPGEAPKSKFDRITHCEDCGDELTRNRAVFIDHKAVCNACRWVHIRGS